METNRNNNRFRDKVRFLDFDLLIISLFSFCFGISLALENEQSISWIGIINSFLTILFALIGNAFFDRVIATTGDEKVRHKKDNSKYLLLAFISITLSLLINVIWIISGTTLSVSRIIFTVLLSVSIIVKAFYEFKYGGKGLREFVIALISAELVPAIAYSYQTTEFSTGFFGLTFGFLLIVLSHFIIRQLQYYGSTVISEKASFLEIVGWKKGLQVHHTMLLSAYLIIFGLGLIKKMWTLYWPLLLSFPVAVLLIINLIRLAQGAKPNWNAIKVLSLSTVLLSIYMPTITFLMRSI